MVRYSEGDSPRSSLPLCWRPRGGDSWALSVYMMLAAVVTILGVYLATEVFIEDDGEPASSREEVREV